MGSGTHKSTTILDGKSDGLTRAMKAAAKENKAFEDQVARLDKQLRKQTAQLDKATARLDRYEKGTKASSRGSESFGSSLKNAGLQAQGWIATVREAVQVVDQLATRQLRFANVSANLPFSIDKARSATKGLVTDFELMRQAVTANRLGVARSEEEFARLAAVSTKLGVSVGRDATSSLDDFVNGLGRGSTEVLDNLGITLRAEEAYKLYAKQLGISTKQLTEMQKRQAVATIGLEKGEEAAKRTTLVLDGLGGEWARLSTEMGNFVDAAINLEPRALGLESKIGNFRKEMFRLVRANEEVVKETIITTIEVKSLDEVLDDLGPTARRAADALEFLAIGFKRVGQAREGLEDLKEARALREIDELESTQRFEAGRDLREKILNEAIKRRKKNIEDARNAAEAQLEVTVELATRQTKILEQQVDAGEATTAQLIGFIDAQSFAELGLAELQFRHAKTRAEQIRLVGGMEAIEHSAATARADARKEQEERLIADSERIATKQLERLEIQREFGLVEAEIAASRAEREAELIEDPLERLQRETDIRLELIDVQIRAANDPIQAMQLADQREATIHDAKLGRLAAERAEREKTAATIRRITDQSTELTLSAAQSVATAVLLEGKGLKESVKNTAASEGAKQAILGASELIRAAIAAASFNAPKAALHVANAAAAFAFAGAMAATFGVASIGGGGRSVAAAPGLGQPGFPGGGGSAPSGGGPGSSPSGDSEDIPESPTSSPVGFDQQDAAGGAATAGATVVNINVTGQIFGTPKRAFVKEMDRGLRDLGYEDRRVSNGD